MGVFIARDLHYGVRTEDDQEFFSDMQFVSFGGIDTLIEQGEINDAQTITGLYFARRWLEKQDRAGSH